MKHQDVLEYYDHDCLQNFPSFFVPLLTAAIFKNSHTVVAIDYVFLENLSKQNVNGFHYQIVG